MSRDHFHFFDLFFNLFEEERICFLAFPGLACEQALLLGQATRASRERASKGPAPRGLAARSRVLARLVLLAQIGELTLRLSRGLNRLTCVTRKIRGDSKLRD